MASPLPDASKVVLELLSGGDRLLLLALVSLVIPATAMGDIYKWTDEQGKINISNVPPPSSGKAKKIEVVLKDADSGSNPGHVATSTEQALLARIESLERQLQARQVAPQVPAVPAQTPYGSYYPPAPPPPPPTTSYYSSGYVASYPVYYPRYTYPVASNYIVYPARTYAPQPAFAAPRGGHAHGGGGHRGRR